MIWLMLFTLIVVFVAGFSVLNSRTRRAIRALNRRLNLDPVYVESLISLMGKQGGEAFIDYLSSDSDSHLANAASVLFLYQVHIVDESEESIQFWRGVLRKAYVPTVITAEHVRLALNFLREIEPDAQEMHAFRQRYNARFEQPEEDDDIRDNVLQFRRRG